MARAQETNPNPDSLSLSLSLSLAVTLTPTLSPTLPLALTADPNPIPNQIVAAKLLVPSARWLPSPQPEHPLFATLLALSHGWVHLLTLTTFTTTFFLGHAHAFWNKCVLPAPQRQP